MNLWGKWYRLLYVRTQATKSRAPSGPCIRRGMWVSGKQCWPTKGNIVQIQQAWIGASIQWLGNIDIEEWHESTKKAGDLKKWRCITKSNIDHRHWSWTAHICCGMCTSLSRYWPWTAHIFHDLYTLLSNYCTWNARIVLGVRTIIWKHQFLYSHITVCLHKMVYLCKM